MYIIVVGAGKVGYYLSRNLLEEGHEVLLIEKDAKKVERMTEELGSVIVLGDAAEATTLNNAGAARADVIIAVTGEDEDNLVVCQIAKQKFRVGRSVARVSNPRNEKVFRLLGIDVIVSQTSYIMNLIEQSIPDQSFVHLLNLRYADLAIVEARIDHDSVVAHQSIGEIKLPVDCVIAAIGRGAHVTIPTGATELLPGDDVIAVTRSDQEDELRRLLCTVC
ncbi:MAG: TrkA-like protein [uncultured Thermomicrobiales bacterium]|uniref:Trk system potassium uptake protein TrkA n=1 Tax=uncultured Thermomicrobiales bacterium TaxID=1645740 RepID=A0A6J4UEQ6_9BACT|nr:MAG: TrkA-like protein [uncultured Thermomicrobiales bacterium]